jgi:PKD repeat protein
MKKIATILILLLFSFGGYSQPWVERTKKENPNFYEIQSEYNKYEKTREANFKGSKQYKRWEWFFESRVNDDGKVPANIYWNEIKRINKTNGNGSRSSANWEALGPFEIPLELTNGNRIGVGRVNCIEYHPTDPETYWIGAPVGGVWKTTDDGSTWTTTTDELLSIGISDIVVNPVNPDILYIATGDRDGPDIYSVGILKSTDGGNTWKTTGLDFTIPDLTNVNEIVINPVDTNVLVAATSAGMYKTTDAGETWNLMSILGNFKDMTCQYGNFDVMVASTYSRFAGYTKVYRSTDAGDTWTLHTDFSALLNNAARTAFATSPADPNIIYAISCTTNNGVMQGIYKSNDAGETWIQISDADTPDLVAYLYPEYQGYGQGWFDLTLVVSPLDANEILVGATHMWRSVDGGDSWTLIQDYYPSPTWIHVDFHEFRYHPIDNRVFACSDGGIYSSDDFGFSWDDLSEGLQILQSYRIGVSASVEDFALMGNQDNGSMRLMDGEVSAINGSDGTECMIDYESPNIVYSSAIYGALYRSTNYGLSWSFASPPGQNGTGAWLTPFAMNPNDPSIIYGGYQALWKSDNRGYSGSWTKISNNIAGKIHRIDIATTNDSVIYICSNSSIYRTNDEGENWKNISGNLPGGFISDIEVSPVDEDVLWVTFGRFNEQRKVYVTRDGGEEWENITHNLPNLPVNCIVYDKNTCDGVYVGNDAGVYYINNSLSEWVEFSDDLPNVIVADIEIQHEFNSLIVGTYGRGLWSSNTYYIEEEPVADFEMEYSDENCWNITFLNTTTAYFDSVYWDFGDGSNSTNLNASYTYNQTGYYMVSLTVFKNEVEYKQTKEINIPEIPVADFSFVMEGYTVHFNNESIDGSEYLWEFGDGNESTEENPSHNYTAFDDYEINLNTYNEICSDSKTKSILLVSVDAIEESKSFDIYPNPSKGIFSVDIKSDLIQEFEIEISSYNSTVLYSQEFINKSQSDAIQIDLRHLSKGIYLLKMSTNSDTFIKKIIIK